LAKKLATVIAASTGHRSLGPRPIRTPTPKPIAGQNTATKPDDEGRPRPSFAVRKKRTPTARASAMLRACRRNLSAADRWFCSLNVPSCTAHVPRGRRGNTTTASLLNRPSTGAPNSSVLVPRKATRACRFRVKTGSALVEHKISASLPKPDIYAHNPVQDALVRTKSASSKATTICPHLSLINSRSGFCRSSHSTAHYHFAYRSRLGFRDRGNLLRYHPLRFTLRWGATDGQPHQAHSDNDVGIPSDLCGPNISMPQIKHDPSPQHRNAPR